MKDYSNIQTIDQCELKVYQNHYDYFDHNDFSTPSLLSKSQIIKNFDGEEQEKQDQDTNATIEIYSPQLLKLDHHYDTISNDVPIYTAQFQYAHHQIYNPHQQFIPHHYHHHQSFLLQQQLYEQNDINAPTGEYINQHEPQTTCSIVVKVIFGTLFSLVLIIGILVTLFLLNEYNGWELI